MAQDSEVTFSMESFKDEARGGFKITITWDGPSDRVFEDCIDFGKYIIDFCCLFFCCISRKKV